MYAVVRKVNEWFRSANKNDVDNLLDKIILSNRQREIFEMYYINKHNVNFIADSINVCDMVVNIELKRIREKIICIL